MKILSFLNWGAGKENIQQDWHRSSRSRILSESILKEPGCGAEQKQQTRTNQLNAAFLRTRIEFINSFFAEDEVDEIWITFPDPHPGKKNSNKRLTCPWFLNKYRTFLKNKGMIHLKTDNTELFNYTRRLVADNRLELLVSADDLYSECIEDKTPFSNLYSRSAGRENIDMVTDSILTIRTHYEKIFLEEGLKINYLAFRLEKEKIIYDGWKKTGIK